MVLRQIGSGIARTQAHSVPRIAAQIDDHNRQAASAIRRAENLKRFAPRRNRESKTKEMEATK